METTSQQEISLYEKLGGEAAVKAFVDRLYTIMDENSDVADIRAMHPDDLSYARQRLFEFLSGWLGGPSLYVKRHGHPRLRRRHMMFSIGDAERDQWMLCAGKAIQGMDLNQKDAEVFHTRLLEMANHLRNQVDPTDNEACFRTMRSVD